MVDDHLKNKALKEDQDGLDAEKEKEEFIKAIQLLKEEKEELRQ